MRDHFARLSAAEALRALYIDFEGQTDQPPVLLGTFRRGRRGDDPQVHQVILDPLFATAGAETRDVHDAIETVVRRAERGDRRIVAWSEHELEVVRRLSDAEPALVERFESRYANARKVARRWLRTCHPAESPAENTLAAYLELIGYAVPPGAEPGHVGDSIRSLQPTLTAGRALTPRQTARWTRLLEHNRHDCAGMRAVCLRATRELEAGAVAPLPWAVPLPDGRLGLGRRQRAEGIADARAQAQAAASDAGRTATSSTRRPGPWVAPMERGSFVHGYDKESIAPSCCPQQQ